MTDISELVGRESEIMELEFNDGHAVVARIVSVDIDEPAEIVYEVLRVVKTGPPSLAHVAPGLVAAAKAHTLHAWRPIAP
jgi:hypothetical protein